MRRETGAKSNPPGAGAEFFESFPCRPVSLVALKTMLAPMEAFEGKQGAEFDERAAALLRLNGMAPASDETVMHTPLDGMMALAAVDFQKANALQKEGVPWTTPLLARAPMACACIWVLRTGGLVYIKVWGAARHYTDLSSRLRLAEVMSAPTAEDLLFYLSAFSQAMELDGYRLVLSGDTSREERRLLKKYFRLL